MDSESSAGRVFVRSDRARPFLERHPWVRAASIERIESNPTDGQVVDLVGKGGRVMARGIYEGRGGIRVRLYSWNPQQPLDASFWRERIRQALALRETLGRMRPSEASRLVFSEADGLSGLIVDRYRDYVVIQVGSVGMAQRVPILSAALGDFVRPATILVKIEPELRRSRGNAYESGVLSGNSPSGPIVIEEHGLKFGVDLLEGQKTGFYLDQRENRLAAAKYAEGKRVLDMFCYTGGFALACAKIGKAAEVLGFDGSERAITLAQANAQLNGATNVRFAVGDAFQTLGNLKKDGQRFGMVVLDPPKFAGGKASVPDALRAYHSLNRLGVELLESGGVLVTCSCSGYVTREDFFNVLFGVAQQTRREIQILEMRGAAPDHPTLVTCKETNYLKCFICRVW